MGDYSDYSKTPIDSTKYSTNIVHRMQNPAAGLEIVPELMMSKLDQPDDLRFKLYKQKQIEPIEEDATNATEVFNKSIQNSPENARQEIDDEFMDADDLITPNTAAPVSIVDDDEYTSIDGFIDANLITETTSNTAALVSFREYSEEISIEDAVDDVIYRWVSVVKRPISKEEMADARKTAERRITLQRDAKQTMINGIGKDRAAYLERIANIENPNAIDQWNSRTELENSYLIQMLLKKRMQGSSITHENRTFQLYELNNLATEYPSLAKYLGADNSNQSFTFQSIEKLFGSQITQINIIQGDWSNSLHGHHEGNRPSIQTDASDLVINITLNDCERLSLKGMKFDEGLITSLYGLVSFEEHTRDQASEHDPSVKFDPKALQKRNLAVIGPESRENFYKLMKNVRFSIPLFGAPEDAYMPRAKMNITQTKT